MKKPRLCYCPKGSTCLGDVCPNTPMTKIREMTYKIVDSYQHHRDIKLAVDALSNLFEEELEKATRCQKPVENGEAICGCKLDCHLHDWRQRDELEKLEVEIKESTKWVDKEDPEEDEKWKIHYGGYKEARKDILEIIRQHKEG